MTFIRPGMHILFADTVRRDLDENYKTAKNVFRQQLQEVSGHLSFTVDAWTSKNQIPFLKIRSYTGANLSQRFLEVFQEFGIITKILAIGYDNASNMDVMLENICSL
ncbi:unnamed protein product [Rhizophagus irregularis]|nr:unnamed protein product [Rhizophagus irregularis]